MAKAYFKWKEQMVYEHEGRFLVFEASMGVSPSDVFVPCERTWPDKVPAWAKDMREEVLQTIRAVTGVKDIVADDVAWVGTEPS